LVLLHQGKRTEKKERLAPPGMGKKRNRPSKRIEEHKRLASIPEGQKEIVPVYTVIHATD
jgi:hypothetical protein